MTDEIKTTVEPVYEAPRTRTDTLIDLCRAILGLPTVKLLLVLTFLSLIGFFVFQYYMAQEAVEFKTASQKELPVETKE